MTIEQTHGAVAGLLQEVLDVAQAILSDQRHCTVVYGSRAYGVERPDSDLDVLFVCDGLDQGLRAACIESIKEVHRRNKIPLDEEVPFDSKLIATWADLTLATSGECFKDVRSGAYVICPVRKDPAFLASDHMRLRLFMNVLCGRVIILDGDAQAFEGLPRAARRCLIVLMADVVPLDCFDIQTLVACLLRNGQHEGEMWLGFKSVRAVQDHLAHTLSHELRCGLVEGWVRRRGGLWSVPSPRSFLGGPSSPRIEGPREVAPDE